MTLALGCEIKPWIRLFWDTACLRCSPLPSPSAPPPPLKNKILETNKKKSQLKKNMKNHIYLSIKCIAFSTPWKFLYDLFETFHSCLDLWRIVSRICLAILFKTIKTGLSNQELKNVWNLTYYDSHTKSHKYFQKSRWFANLICCI